ncbi:MAG: CDP-diacylglycerol--glycerol-3-phosphate 3-phosphatidyltransferase [Angelakisella sp.]
MNLPNKLTVLRMLLIPVFLFCMLVPFQHHFLVALLVFAGASLTDLFDGKIARARGLVTNFGKFMDPLADKLLVMSALVCLAQLPSDLSPLNLPVVVLVLILSREFAVTALRTLAADNGVVIAADKWGKLKTVSQMSWICYALLMLWAFTELPLVLPELCMLVVYWAGMAVVVVATVGSGINYLWKNRTLFTHSK